ncbi:hypothetical protein HU200_038394 [Digitaria exilis]|uniref:Uncharacterized protein n=1 Tax=Digitaria exilis TaxID=1010633 RepID=A0A835EGG1_9POAL|nr:hypothetical protein HU200_038394 [Digitaria exilis]
MLPEPYRGPTCSIPGSDRPCSSMYAAVLARRAAALRSAAPQGYFRWPSRRVSTAATATTTSGKAKAAKPWADLVPVYGAVGATALSVTLGLGTAGHELAHAPNVRLDKKKRETVPEVAAPDLAVDEAERLRRRSLFRRIARFADDRFIPAGPVAYNHHTPGPRSLSSEKKAVTLKDAGVEPPGIERSREEVLGNFVFKRSRA